MAFSAMQFASQESRLQRRTFEQASCKYSIKLDYRTAMTHHSTGDKVASPSEPKFCLPFLLKSCISFDMFCKEAAPPPSPSAGTEKGRVKNKTATGKGLDAHNDQQELILSQAKHCLACKGEAISQSCLPWRDSHGRTRSRGIYSVIALALLHYCGQPTHRHRPNMKISRKKQLHNTNEIHDTILATHRPWIEETAANIPIPQSCTMQHASNVKWHIHINLENTHTDTDTH